MIFITKEDAVRFAVISRELERMTADRLLFGKTFTEEESKRRINDAIENLSEEEREEIETEMKKRFTIGT